MKNSQCMHFTIQCYLFLWLNFTRFSQIISNIYFVFILSASLDVVRGAHYDRPCRDAVVHWLIVAKRCVGGLHLLYWIVNTNRKTYHRNSMTPFQPPAWHVTWNLGSTFGTMACISQRKINRMSLKGAWSGSCDPVFTFETSSYLWNG